jgi:hypothetical protein
MSTSVLPPPGGGHKEFLGEGLATVACEAAIELDNLVRGRSESTGSIRKLADRLTKELPEASDLSSIKHLIDPSTVIVMSGAIRELLCPGPMRGVQDLTRAAGKVAQRLLLISGNPAGSRGDLTSLEELRDFCLALSRRAAAARGAVTEAKPRHPRPEQG